PSARSSTSKWSSPLHHDTVPVPTLQVAFPKLNHRNRTGFWLGMRSAKVQSFTGLRKKFRLVPRLLLKEVCSHRRSSVAMAEGQMRYDTPHEAGLSSARGLPPRSLWSMLVMQGRQTQVGHASAASSDGVLGESRSVRQRRW